ncbi:hypothetical protein [Micromonospora echinofusca]|uniref:Uncharacterized protein n=1 Tax=Micromonospora echinofusca TaxID=47858 RepID=A0ABS3VZ85_MICEH|nr:hypothetical protein [Micromonospora echinofusca]MBO4209866.1 hypothetical protein [Micromonospora echinofusca]
MVRKVGRRLAVVVGLLLGALLPVGAAAQAAPKVPAGVSIAGDGLAEPLRLRAETDPDRVSAVIEQVNWLGRATPSRALPVEDLGPKYTVLVFAGDVAKETYDLFPLAKGGPRAYRPAKQPDLRRVAAGWFLGRLNMAEVLRAVGVPLAEKAGAVTGGIGGGERIATDDETLDPGQDLDRLFGDLQRLLLLNAGVIVVITAGLAGIALLVRRRTR